MSAYSSCPFCSHGKHDGQQCDKCYPSECVGPTEAERAAYEAPERIFDWLYLILENEALCSRLVTDVHHYTDPERLVLTTPTGLFTLRIERGEGT